MLLLIIGITWFGVYGLLLVLNKFVFNKRLGIVAAFFVCAAVFIGTVLLQASITYLFESGGVDIGSAKAAVSSMFVTAGVAAWLSWQYSQGWESFVKDEPPTKVRQDGKQAVELCLKAAKQGDVFQQINLGNMYYEGIGVQKDDAQAYFWTAIAAKQGDRNSLKVSKIIARCLTPSQVAQLQEQVRNWEPTTEG